MSVESGIRISSPQFGTEEEQLVVNVLRSGRIAQGPMVEEFEKLCAEMAGTSRAVAVSNGTVSLEAILAVLGIGPGDEVITSPFTFVATLNAIIRAGATARFADITAEYTLDPASVDAVIGPRTAAIMPVHLYGLMGDMPSLSSLAERNGLALIEDAAQAHGASADGRSAGSFGIGSFSFYATKNVTAGEGGVVTTSDENVADRIRLLRNQGMRTKYEYEAVGSNLRMTDLQAALAIPQLRRLRKINSKRAANARALSAELERLEGLVLPLTPPERVHAWHQYTVLLPHPENRERIVGLLSSAGIESGVYYPRLVWDHLPFRDHKCVVPDDTPVAAGVVQRCLSLPIHQQLVEEDITKVSREMRKALASGEM
jgi:perosamine synthetase